jgi:RNA polymerase sigma factor (sigma-70 family)
MTASPPQLERVGGSCCHDRRSIHSVTVAVTLAARRPADVSAEQFAERAVCVGYRSALGILGDPDAAADVAQEVALVALRRGHTLRDPERRDVWLHRTAVRAALRAARRDRSRRDAENAQAERAGAASQELEPELAGALALLDGLPARQRAALTLRYVHDLPDAAIARALGCRKATVRSLLSRGRAAVRARLDIEEAT